MEETKEKVIGKYKTNRKFISFLSALQGARVRLFREIAYIDGKQLSGVLDGAKFKITICDEGTINFEVVENNSLTPNIDDSMIERLITSIDEMRVNGYAQKFVVSDLEFKDEDGSRCYLEVEHQKPIDRFASILDSFKEEKSADTTLSDKGFSILDALFSSESEFEGESEQIILSERDAEISFGAIENPQEPNDNLKSAVSYMEEQFIKMNESKINELKKRIENTEKEVERIRGEISMSEKKLKNQVEDLKVLETRLDSFNKNDDLNGYVFYVSEEQKAEDIGLTEDNRAIADKIADILSLKKDVLFKMLTEGHYKIRIAEKSDMAAEKVKVTADILEKIKSLVNGDESLEAKVTMVEPGQFEYRGSLNWHQVVGKMIRKGFEQEPEFDKLCQSNSYDSHEEEKDEIENIIN
jgi:TolA-binding protein